MTYAFTHMGNFLLLLLLLLLHRTPPLPPTSRPISQPRGSYPSLETQIPVVRPKLLEAGIWALKMGFWPQDGIWSLRLGFEPQDGDLGLKAGIRALVINLVINPFRAAAQKGKWGWFKSKAECRCSEFRRCFAFAGLCIYRNKQGIS